MPSGTPRVATTSATRARRPAHPTSRGRAECAQRVARPRHPRIARTAAHPELDGKHQRKAERDENECDERPLSGPASPARYSGIEFGGECAEAQQRESAKLGQRIERDKKHAAEQRGSKLRKDDPQEGIRLALSPSERAVSSSAGSMPRNAAATGR